MNESPIFIVGNSRSGTTMMGRILNEHELIFTFHELHFFEQLWSKKDSGQVISGEEAAVLFAKLLKAQRSGILTESSYIPYLIEAKEALKKIKQPYTTEQVFRSFLLRETKLNGKIFPCEQTPRNLLYLEELLFIYPRAKIIAMVRDPRDVMLSQKGKWKRRYLGGDKITWFEALRSRFNYHPISIAKLWNINYEVIQRFELLPSVFVLRFEDLVDQPEQTVKAICDFLQIDYSPQLLSIPQIGSSNQQDQNQVGISKSTVGKWRHDTNGLTKTEIFICQQICGSGMKEYNYHAESVRPRWINYMGASVTFPFKLMVSFLLNIKRMKNIRESVGKRLSLIK